MRRWLTLLAAPALALTLVVTSCERSDSPMPEGLTGPVADSLKPDALIGGLLDGLLGSDATTVTDESGQEYTLVKGRIPSLIRDLRVSKLIGPDGGVLALAGHKLIVPEDAVDQLTLFTLTLVTDGHVEVEITALVNQLFRRLDIGAQGFDQPVTLSLAYAWASNVYDPQELVILRMPGDDHSGPHQVMPSTVDENRKVVTTHLDRFSRYCMAM